MKMALRAAALVLAAVLAACSSSSSAPAPSFTQQPSSAVVTLGYSATFRVAADGDGITYAWRRNGVAIAGATAATYVTPPAQLGQDGDRFTAVATDSHGVSVESSAARLRLEGFRATGAMLAARQDHEATRLASGKVLVTGGFNGAVLGAAELYDEAAGTFAATAGPLAAARQRHTATLLASGKVLVAGGEGGAGGGLPLATAEVYNPGTGLFEPAGALTTTRTRHTATRLASGKVLLAGGLATVSATSDLALCELYDPSTNAFEPTGALSVARHWQTATLLPGGKVLVAGGYANGAALDTAELYDPGTGLFTDTAGRMQAARYGHTATLLPGGKVLLAGGYGGGFLQSAELFDPATGTFELTADLVDSRYFHAAAALADGKVLLVGGYGPSALRASAEYYDPETILFQASGAAATARVAHVAVLLPSGEVLVAGGFSIGDHGLTSAELHSGPPTP